MVMLLALLLADLFSLKVCPERGAGECFKAGSLSEVMMQRSALLCEVGVSCARSSKSAFS